VFGLAVFKIREHKLLSELSFFALHSTSLIASCFDPLARSRKPFSEHQSEPTVFPRKCHSGVCGRLFMPTIWLIGYLTTLFQTQESIPEKSWRYDHEWKVGAILKAAVLTFFKVNEKAKPIDASWYNGWTCVSISSNLSRLIRVLLQKRLLLNYYT